MSNQNNVSWDGPSSCPDEWDWHILGNANVHQLLVQCWADAGTALWRRDAFPECGSVDHMYYVSFFQLTGHLWAIACPSAYISMGPDIGCKLVSLHSQQAWDVDTVLVWCWASVVDGGPTSNQHRINVSRLQGCHCLHPVHDRTCTRGGGGGMWITPGVLGVHTS